MVVLSRSVLSLVLISHFMVSCIPRQVKQWGTRVPCLARRYGNSVGEPHAAPQPYKWGSSLTAANPRLKLDSQTSLSNDDDRSSGPVANRCTSCGLGPSPCRECFDRVDRGGWGADRSNRCRSSFLCRIFGWGWVGWQTRWRLNLFLFIASEAGTDSRQNQSQTTWVGEAPDCLSMMPMVYCHVLSHRLDPL